MNEIKGIPYSAAEFDKEGVLLKEPQVPPGTTDLIVVSHGWNNDQEAAENLYRKLFENFADVTAGDAAIQQRKIAIIGILWPSKKFDDFWSEAPASRTAVDGAAAFGDETDKAVSHKAMREAIDRAAPLFNDQGDAQRLDRLRELIPQLEDDTARQAQFVETLRELVDPEQTLPRSDNDGSAVFFEDMPGEIFKRARKSVGAPPPRIADDQARHDEGEAAGVIGNLFSGATRAVTSLLNLTTYYEMKKRAGTVGKQGVAPLIDKLAEKLAETPDRAAGRIHLVGHSFGGRLVTAAAAESATGKIHSLSLLQAAFSHNGFSKIREGFFRTVVDNQRVKGPILVTHTRNDTAVGRAYPLASRISGVTAASLGDANDEFGGIGSNGAQRMEDGEVAADINELLPTGQPYAWKSGKFHNLESSMFIVDPKGGDAHGFVYVPQVAWALSRVIVS